MSIADDLLKLQSLRESGAINDEEFEVAKAKILGGVPLPAMPTAEHFDQQLKQISQQNELASIDREWEIKREDYMIRGENGHRYVPTRGMSVVSGVMVVGFGIFWLMTLSSMGGPGGGGLAFFGVLFICFGIGMSIYSFTKAEAFEDAQNQYRARRKKLIKGRKSD
jgi:hypothetical protein